MGNIEIDNRSFSSSICLDLDEWLGKLPPDFTAIMQHDGHSNKKEQFKDAIDALTELNFDDNMFTKGILTDFGDIGRFRLLSRIAKEMQLEGIFVIDMLATMSPEDNGIRGTLDRFRKVLAERMSKSLTDDVRFKQMLSISMPELSPANSPGTPQKGMKAVT